MADARTPDIIVIPEKFYGVALKLKAPDVVEQEQKPTAPPPPKPTPKPTAAPVDQLLQHRHWPTIVVVVGIVVVIAGGFTYFSRDLIFRKTPPPSTAPAPVLVPPSTPAEFSATVTGAAVSLTWVDASIDETGYRLERKEVDGTFTPLTNLPPDSAAFLDSSVLPEKIYTYQLIAIGPGGESAPSNPSTVSTALAPAPKVSPLPPGGLDSDSDGLSDVEEPLYGTDSSNPDADKDGFLDGNEVFHLYNPAAIAPVRLLDSGLVKVFSSPIGWSLYVPSTWQTSMDSPDGTSAVIDTGHGEKFSLSLQENPEKKALLDWYLERHPGTLSSAVRPLVTKGRLEGILGADRLEAYFPWDGKVFVLRYDLGGQTFVNFRTTYEMLLQSLKLVGAPLIAIPPATSVDGPGGLIGSSITSTSVQVTSTGEVPVSVGVPVASTGTNLIAPATTSSVPVVTSTTP